VLNSITRLNHPHSSYHQPPPPLPTPPPCFSFSFFLVRFYFLFIHWCSFCTREWHGGVLVSSFLLSFSLPFYVEFSWHPLYHQLNNVRTLPNVTIHVDLVPWTLLSIHRYSTYLCKARRLTRLYMLFVLTSILPP
jgi:hypothetical protein